MDRVCRMPGAGRIFLRWFGLRRPRSGFHPGHRLALAGPGAGGPGRCRIFAMSSGVAPAEFPRFCPAACSLEVSGPGGGAAFSGRGRGGSQPVGGVSVHLPGFTPGALVGPVPGWDRGGAGDLVLSLPGVSGIRARPGVLRGCVAVLAPPAGFLRRTVARACFLGLAGTCWALRRTPCCRPQRCRRTRCRWPWWRLRRRFSAPRGACSPRSP